MYVVDYYIIYVSLHTVLHHENSLQCLIERSLLKNINHKNFLLECIKYFDQHEFMLYRQFNGTKEKNALNC